MLCFVGIKSQSQDLSRRPLTPPLLALRTLLFSFHPQAKKSISSHLSTLADFAIDMFDVLDEINYQSYNDFVLRVGR